MLAVVCGLESSVSSWWGREWGREENDQRMKNVKDRRRKLGSGGTLLQMGEESAQPLQCVDLHTYHTTPRCLISFSCVLGQEHLFTSSTPCPQGVSLALCALWALLFRHLCFQLHKCEWALQGTWAAVVNHPSVFGQGVACTSPKCLRIGKSQF